MNFFKLKQVYKIKAFSLPFFTNFFLFIYGIELSLIASEFEYFGHLRAESGTFLKLISHFLSPF